MLYPGSAYITGNISPYIASYYGVTTTQTSNILLTNMVLNAFTLPIGTWLCARGTNPKLTLAIGASIGISLMFFASYTKSYTAFHWLYSLSWVINNGITYFAACNEAWKFFPDKPGLASGVILSGFGFGGLIFDNVSTALINPLDYAIGTPEFNQVVQEKFGYMLRVLDVCWFGILLFGIATIWKGPDNLDLKLQQLRAELESPTTPETPLSDDRINKTDDRLTTTTVDRLTAPTLEAAEADYDPSQFASVKEMLFSKQSIILYFVSTLSVFTGFFVINQTKNFGVLNGLVDDKGLALIASIGSIFNALRFPWSWWLDYSSVKVVLSTLIISQIVLNFTIFLVDKNWYTYALWMWMFMNLEGGFFVVLPNTIKKMFGSKGIAVYGFFGSFIAFVGLIQIFLDDFFLKPDSLKSYNSFFVFNGVLSILALALLLLLYKDKKYVPKSLRK